MPGGRWRSSGAGLLLIAHPSLSVEPEMVAEAVRQGHHVLLPSGLAPRERPMRFKLPAVYRYDLEKALVSSGLEEEERGGSPAKRAEASPC